MIQFDRWDKRPYLQRVGDGLSQFLNVILLNGMTDESISGRCWRNVALKEHPKLRWLFLYGCAELLMYPVDKWRHCELAYLQDVERSRVRAEFINSN